VTAALALAALLSACVAAPAVTPSSTPIAEPPAATASAAPIASDREDSPAPTPTATPEPLAWRDLGLEGPAAREDHTWTLDPAGATAYLFGGRDGATVHGDLWAYDMATEAWSRLEVESGPAPRFGHEAIWVDDVGLVIFAGQAGTTFFSDLWAFDPNDGTWRALPSAGDAPLARYGTCAGIGPDGRLWISHGFTSDGTRFADTRVYDFGSGTWSDETPPGEVPVSRCLHGCWWTDDGELALFGGQTTGVTALDDRWLLGDDGWIRVEGTAPPARNLYGRARLDGAMLVFGGQALDGGRLDDLWVLADDGGDAIELVADARPPGRSGAEMVVDVPRGRVILFGGLGADGALDDTWALTGIPMLPAP
jgi:hypothetical protein